MLLQVIFIKPVDRYATLHHVMAVFIQMTILLKYLLPKTVSINTSTVLDMLFAIIIALLVMTISMLWWAGYGLKTPTLPGTGLVLAVIATSLALGSVLLAWQLIRRQFKLFLASAEAFASQQTLATAHQQSQQDQQSQQQALRDHCTFLESLIDHLPTPVYAKRMDTEGGAQFIAWNQTARQITGFSAAEVIGKTDRQVFSNALANANEMHDRHIRANPAPLEIPAARFTRADGVVRYLRFLSVPIFGQNGSLDYIVGIGEDVTERRKQDQKLRTSQAQLQALNDSLPLALFMTDVAGNFTYINKTYEAISGFTAKQLVGDTWFRCLHPDDQEAAIEGWVAAIGRREAYQNTHRVIRPDCTPSWGSFKAVPLLVDQMVTGYIGSVEDITGRLEAERALRASEQRLRLITDNIPALIAYITPEQRFEFANRRYQSAFDLPSENLTGMLESEVLGPYVYAQSVPYIEGALRGAGAIFERLVTHGGQLRWERVSYIPEFDDQQCATGYFSLVEDITELKQAQHTFAKSEMRLRMITDNLPALVAFIDHDERFQFNNQRYVEWLGKPLSKITGYRMQEVYDDKDYQRNKPYLDQALKGARVEFEFEAVRDGRVRYFRADYAPQLDNDGQTIGVCSMISDITALKKVENQLRTLARFDSLTGLPNRNHFEEKLNEAIGRSKRSTKLMAVMFLDIDHFKTINDTLGHHSGDLVLKEFALRLQHCVRKTDTVARLAGDEFTIILEELRNDSEAAIIAQKIIHVMRDDFLINDTSRAITTSIGIAVRRADETDAQAFLQRADKALYAAKAAGRNTFEASPEVVG